MQLRNLRAETTWEKQEYFWG